MAKSRIALSAALLWLAVPAAAEPGAADALVEQQRSELRAAMRLDCRRPGDENEIIVCGSRERDQRERLPPLPGQGSPSAADRAGGEQRAALAVDTSPCTTVGRDQRCTRGLDMIGIGFAIARAVGQALANRD